MKAVEPTSRPQSATATISGASMDRKIEKKSRSWLAIAGVSVLVLALLAIGWLIVDQSSGRSLTIADSRVMIAPVSEGLFEDYIPIRGRVTPRKRFISMSSKAAGSSSAWWMTVRWSKPASCWW